MDTIAGTDVQCTDVEEEEEEQKTERGYLIWRRGAPQER